MTLRVLHILCDLSGGGAERLVLELAARHRPEFDVRVATVQGGGPLQAAFESREIPLLLGSRKPGWVWDNNTVRSLTAAIDAVDIVHTHLFAGHFWGRVAARRSGRARVISTVHNIDRDERWYHRQLRRRTANWADHTVCVSEAVRAHCLESGWANPDQISVIENGVDLDRFAPPKPVVAKATKLLAIGRLVPQKGFDILIQACGGLDVTVEIVGEGPERSRLEAIAPPNVRLLGAQEDIPRRLADADLFVVPSRWEGFGLVAAEAMAAGVPVVATHVDGLREVLGAKCAAVPPDDVEALRAALIATLGDERERKERVDEGLARVKARFDLRRAVEDYANRYRSLLGNDRAET